jgi:hypothetical protein
MMDGTLRALGAFTLGVGLLAATPSHAADLIASVEDAYAVRDLRHTPFDPRAALRLAPEESRFLEDLFASTDEAVLLNTNAGHWFFTDGARGIHPEDYLGRADLLLERLDQLETPKRVESVRGLLIQSLLLQRSFLMQWHQARREGRPFPSQLTDEFAYHEGLHRSQRLLLKAFAELYALFPDAGETTHRAFHDHLRAVDLK